VKCGWNVNVDFPMEVVDCIWGSKMGAMGQIVMTCGIWVNENADRLLIVQSVLYFRVSGAGGGLKNAITAHAINF
jgi:hypothetical protein